jgi:hypothetical protein
MGRVYSTNGKKRNAYENLVGKPAAKINLERPRHKLEYNIKMNFREMG